jgi:hypothetical protein
VNQTPSGMTRMSNMTGKGVAQGLTRKKQMPVVKAAAKMKKK